MRDVRLRAVQERGSGTLLGGALCAGLRMRHRRRAVQAVAAAVPAGPGAPGGQQLLRGVRGCAPVHHRSVLCRLQPERSVRADGRCAGRPSLPVSGDGQPRGEMNMLSKDLRALGRAAWVLAVVVGAGCTVTDKGINTTNVLEFDADGTGSGGAGGGVNLDGSAGKDGPSALGDGPPAVQSDALLAGDVAVAPT